MPFSQSTSHSRMILAPAVLGGIQPVRMCISRGVRQNPLLRIFYLCYSHRRTIGNVVSR